MKLKIKKGLNLNLAGSITDIIPVMVNAVQAAVYPDDFPGFIPKSDVKPGDIVLAGDALLHDKTDSRIKIVSPVSGTVLSVDRGERRHIDRIVVKADNTAPTKKFDTAEATSDPAKAMELLAEAGILALIRQRPYAIVPRCDVRPRDIFVSAFDSAPLAVDRTWLLADKTALQAGADFLAAITTGKVYVSHREDDSLPMPDHVADVVVSGPHPAGLPGIQAANIAPVCKGETIWTMSAETMWRIGRLVLTGKFDATTFVGVSGWAIEKPFVAQTILGASVEDLIKKAEPASGRHLRFISGNVLTGIKIDAEDGYLHYPYTQLTVIPEGDEVDEFMGWASMSANKMSVSPTFPGKLLGRIFHPDARMNGAQRAIIMSGEYDRVLPMDIYAEYLIKAIQSKDIDNMEKLGIYEVAPEDFALAECIDSSKLPLQNIVREGLDYLRKEIE